MLEETGTVIDTQGDTLWVQTISRSSCSKCSTSACSTSVIGKLFNLKRNVLQMENTLQAIKGQRVVIGIPDSTLVKASVWAYLVPIVFMVAATMVALSLGAGDALQAMVAAAGLVLGFMVVKRVMSRVTEKGQFEPLLLRFEGAHPVVSVDLGDIVRTKPG
jgi:sigma-E factor negative regulatory protein RseC